MTELTDRALTMLESNLASYQAWRLHMRCGNTAKVCAQYGVIELGQLCELHGNHPMADIIKKLRCGRCGGLPKSIKMRHHLASEWLLGSDSD